MSAHRWTRPGIAILLALLWLASLGPIPRAQASGPPAATTVYGQGGSFTTNTANYNGVTATSLNQPWSVAVDSSGNLYVADRNNNRVLYYAAGSTTATRVYGQGGSFGSSGAGTSATSLSGPIGVAVDSSGNLYVADTNNNRVLYYAAGSTTATRVYGQGGSFTTGTANNGGISANSLNNPQGVAVDSAGNLYVADTGNSRVLYYTAGSTTATRVYGQGGNFTSSAQNNGGVSANSLADPRGVALDSSGNLYVVDTNNNRVLYYQGTSTTATRVYGQADFTSNGSGTSATTFTGPQGLTVDSTGNLYVADYSNNRVLFFAAGSTTATRVYGQPDFTSSAPNNGGVSATSLNTPFGLAVDSSGNLYVAENNNNRVLAYPNQSPPSGGGTGTPELGSGELLLVGLPATLALLLMQRRRRRRNQTSREW